MKRLTCLLCLTVIWPISSSLATPIVFDLNDGTFVTLPATGGQTVDYTGVYQSPTFDIVDMIVNGGETFSSCPIQRSRLDLRKFFRPTELW